MGERWGEKERERKREREKGERERERERESTGEVIPTQLLDHVSHKCPQRELLQQRNAVALPWSSGK